MKNCRPGKVETAVPFSINVNTDHYYVVVFTYVYPCNVIFYGGYHHIRIYICVNKSIYGFKKSRQLASCQSHVGKVMVFNFKRLHHKISCHEKGMCLSALQIS